MWSKQSRSKRLWRYYLRSAERMMKLFRIINVTFLLGSTAVILVLISLFTPLFSQVIVYVFTLLPLPKVPAIAKHSPPTAYVVLGGGLTNDRNNQTILNPYSLNRASPKKANLVISFTLHKKYCQKIKPGQLTQG